MRPAWRPSRISAVLRHLCLFAGLSAAWAASDYSTPYSFTTLAGFTSIGSDDGPGAVARFYEPTGIAVDRSGNVYVADQMNNTIRKITPEGIVSTLAGTAGRRDYADGTGGAALFNNPESVAVDGTGNVYVADKLSMVIRKITPAGVVTTFAGTAGERGSIDGTGSAARFYVPAGIAVDPASNVYVSEWCNNTIRKITPTGVVTTLAGTAGIYGSTDGTGADASFFFPTALAVDAAGTIYVAELDCTIRKVTPDGVVTTLAGQYGVFGSADGPGRDARFYSPAGIGVDRAGNVYVGDSLNDTIRKITPDGVVTTLAGIPGVDGSADGNGVSARFRHPGRLAVDASGAIYVADVNNNTIRKISPTAEVTTFAGLGLDNSVGSTDGAIPQARFNDLASAAVGPAGEIYVADAINSTVRKITPNGVVSTLAGTAGTMGSADGAGSAAQFNTPYGIAVDATGTVYVSDPGNDNIRKITSSGVVTTLAGDATAPAGHTDGAGSAARFNYPSGVAVDEAGNVFVADRDNSVIRRIAPAGVVTTLAGSADGSGSAATFEAPQGVAVDSAGNLYVANAIRHGAIKKISPAGTVTTLAGGTGGEADSADGVGTDARFNKPQGVVVDRSGNVFVAEGDNCTIRKISPAGVVSTLAGLAGAAGNADGLGSQSRFLSPRAVTVDTQGNLYVPSGTTVRKGLLATTPVITTQPLSLSAIVGTSAVIAVSASGAPDPTYQWRLNGNAINGASGRSLALASVQATDAGDYTVVVANQLGSVTSTKATLTVTPAATPPASNPSASGSGGGGSMGAWFALSLLIMGAARRGQKAVCPAKPQFSVRGADRFFPE